MYDLEQTIETWRNELTMHELIVQENIEELEDHLRMSILQLTKQGLAEDEGFLIASRRIGVSSNLDVEFRKVNAVKLVASKIAVDDCWHFTFSSPLWNMDDYC